MNILFIAPYPPSRIRSRSYGFIDRLRHEHSITILSQVTTQQEWKDVASLREQGYEIVTVTESKQRSLLRSGLALFSSYPLQAAYARSSQFLQTMRHMYAQRNFDIVHIEHLRGIASLEPALQGLPFVWDAVDCMSSLWQQAATVGSNRAMRALARIEHTRTERYEAYLMKNHCHISVITEIERQAMLTLFQRIYPHDNMEESNTRIEVLPNGVDTDYFTPAQERYRDYNIVFSGKMSYHANVAAVHHLHQHIMPLIWREQPATTLTIVGNNPPRSIQNLASDPRVEVTGYVEDIRPYIRHAHIMMSPMVYSVGMQNKVLEAMALGTPAVTTAQSARALYAQPGRDVLIATSADEFARNAIRLMNDADLHNAISLHGRRYVEQYHSWQVITQQLVNMYQRAVNATSQKRLTPVSESPSIHNLKTCENLP